MLPNRAEMIELRIIRMSLENILHCFSRAGRQTCYIRQLRIGTSIALIFARPDTNGKGNEQTCVNKGKQELRTYQPRLPGGTFSGCPR